MLGMNGFHVFLPAAAASVTRQFFPPRKPGHRPFFLFGGCLFWLVIIYVWAAFQALRVGVWAAILAVLTVAQGLSLLGELAWRPVRLIT